jgi:3-deoxy-manno-octulosonate cytidylyltransferase (CMP-KDO synthetase)
LLNVYEDEMSIAITCHNTAFGTAGQIDPSHLVEIAAQGYKSVINNRPDGEAGLSQPKNADIAAQAVGVENVYVATENQEIVDVVKAYNYKVILTSDDCLTGTDRVAEAAFEIDADIIINIQGDEPMLDPKDILRVIEAKKNFPEHVINCQAYLNSNEDVESKKIPKVITNLNDELIYSSRNPIPGTKTGNGKRPKKQVCIYGFNREQLKAFTDHSTKTPLEFEEDIEILRFIELGYKVKMVEVDGSTVAVDYPEDINLVEGLL